MAKTITFIGASTGCGNHALAAALAAGHTCIALCRVPSKLDSLSTSYPNTLIVKSGNAHDVPSVAACLVHDGRLVDAINTSIGSTMDTKTFKFIDPDVCKKGMATLLEALRSVRETQALKGRPLISIVSTNGIADTGRDFPLLLYPVYHYMLATPHADKKVMEAAVQESGERFVLVRPSLLMDGDCPEKTIRVGVEDVQSTKIEKKEVGYSISRGAVGRWIYENVLARADDKLAYEGKAVSITW